MKGRIFDIAEFSLHDGPGVRTTVFLKGCPLRCMWCHNPESQNFGKELMVSYRSCSHCGKCTALCASPGNCVSCGACVSGCPSRLRKLVGEDIEAAVLAGVIKKNNELFEKSGGGVTISGGEPLFQPAFCIELMEELSHGHVALDTSGFAGKDIFKEAVGYASLVLFDVKLMDADKHYHYTGVDNKLILENLEQLCSGETPFLVRVPLISGVNDDEEFTRDLCQRIRGARNLIRVDLLPYHRGAGAKYAMLGRAYEPDFDLYASPGVQRDIFQEYSIPFVNQAGYGDNE